MITSPRMTILGSGTSAGVPVIGCECAVCTSDDPRDQRMRPAGCLQFIDEGGAERVIMLDAGPDLRAQSLRHRLKRLDAILFTHNHVDHTFGLDDVRRFNAVMHAPIPIWGDERTLEHLHRVYRHIFEQHKNVNDSFVATLIAHLVGDDLQPIDLHGVRATPLRLLHGKLPILGYRFDALEGDRIAARQPAPLPLAYCTDVSGIPPETWPQLRGLDTLILNMLRFRKHPTHFSVDESLDAAGRIAARRTWFIHMNHEVKHAELDPQLPENMKLSFDGLVID